MKKNLHTLRLAAALLLPMLLGGCVQEETIDGPASAGKGLTIGYSFDDLQTRAVSAEPKEKKLGDVYLVFYNTTGRYIGYGTASAPSGSPATGSLALTISPGLLTEGEKYRTLIVGNYDRYPAGSKPFGTYMTENSSKTYDDMRRDIQSQSQATSRIPDEYLPLYGTLLGQDGQEALFTAPAADATGTLPGVSVRFSRAVCRIDLRSKAADRLVIAWAKVCNYRDAGYFFHQDVTASLSTTVKGTAASAPTDVNNMPPGYAKLEPPIANTNSQELIHGGLYAYPNMVGTVAQDDEHTTCLLIAGYYQPTNGQANTTTLTYYRLNVADPGMSQVLKRNFIYTLTIISVKGPGAASEDEAMKEKNPLLNYTVDDQWENDPDGTVTDPDGNFLTVSRTSVVLDAAKESAATIKVTVKEGLSWHLDRSKLTDKFAVDSVDIHTFIVKTTEDNLTDYVNKGEITVHASKPPTGPGPGQPENILQITINLIQMSVKNEYRMLTVEGQTGTLNIEVPGQGAHLNLMVLTGGLYGGWTAEADPSLMNFIGADYTKFGANKARIQIEFQPNTTGLRSGTMTVKRTPANTNPPVPDVTINFTQKKTDHLLTIFPNYGEQGLTVEGFSPATDNPDGVKTNIPFQIYLADGNAYTYKVESNFRADAEAFLTYDAQPYNKRANYTANAAGSVIPKGTNGKTFYLSIFRTGPGDDDLTRTIKVTAVPNTAGQPSEEISFNVTITSGCVLGDVTVGQYTVMDRNYGTQWKSQSALAKNYSTNQYSPDYNLQNEVWAGQTVKGDLNALCQEWGMDNYSDGQNTGWKAPTWSEFDDMLKSNLVMTRGRMCLVSDAKNNRGQYVGCWLPFAREQLPTNPGSSFKIYAMHPTLCIGAQLSPGFSTGRTSYEVRRILQVTTPWYINANPYTIAQLEHTQTGTSKWNQADYNSYLNQQTEKLKQEDHIQNATLSLPLRCVRIKQ